MSFTVEHLRALPESRRDLLSTVLLGLFRDSLGPRHDTRYADYAPQALPIPARHAAYSANLVILAMLTTGEVAGTSLFPASGNPVEDWRKLALLWRSQLPAEGWDGLIDAVTLDRIWAGDQRNIILRPNETAEQPACAPDPLWDLDIGPGHKNRTRDPNSSSIWSGYLDNGRLRNQARFICDAGDDVLIHALQPFAGDLGGAVTAFHSYGPEGDRAVSAANALITLWLTSGYDSTPRRTRGSL